MWALRITLAAALLPRLVVNTLALGRSVPHELLTPVTTGEGALPTSTRFVDRDGLFMQERRSEEGARAHPMRLDAFGLRLRQAIVAAEDQRFDSHSGVDWVATTRALVTSVAHGRWISGASTITQQLARTVTHAPRTAAAKLGVMALAVRIEASLSKDEILEQYLNRIDFGPRIVGAEAASEFYFEKASADLSLAESAALAGLPRGPTLYDPRRGGERLRARRDVILDRMLSSGFATAEEVAAAKSEPLVLAPRLTPRPAPHLVSAIVRGAFGVVPGDAVHVATTIDSELQQRAETAARKTARDLEAFGGSAASVVVIENATGDVLAYVGAPDVTDEKRRGANDGVLARRQPGSALKPFVYELGMERRGWTPSTPFADVETSFPAPDGSTFRPRNYDERFHGPVLLRDALGNSFNVPAVRAAEELGVPDLLVRLRSLGFASLDRSASHYGLALALGDGETTLLELANAYATLARGGVALPVRAIRSISRASGEPDVRGPGEATRVLDARAAWMTTDVLADRAARLSSFGEGSVLEFAFPVAAKTGTSKGYRDNIAVGFSSRVTVAVWVGNFDGAPMKGISGITGAGPLFNEVMRAASERWTPGELSAPDGIVQVDVCPLSGGRATEACPHRRRDVARAGAPEHDCAWHARRVVDRANGLLAGPACAVSDVEERVFEDLPPALVPWARSTGRTLAPAASSPRCPAAPGARVDDLRVTFPEDGAQFHLDPAAAGPSGIRVRGRARSGSGVVLVLDGAEREWSDAGVELRLTPGAHVLLLRDRQKAIDGEPVRFTVD